MSGRKGELPSGIPHEKMSEVFVGDSGHLRDEDETDGVTSREGENDPLADPLAGVDNYLSRKEEEGVSNILQSIETRMEIGESENAPKSAVSLCDTPAKYLGGKSDIFLTPGSKPAWEGRSEDELREEYGIKPLKIQMQKVEINKVIEYDKVHGTPAPSTSVPKVRTISSEKVNLNIKLFKKGEKNNAKKSMIGKGTRVSDKYKNNKNKKVLKKNGKQKESENSSSDFIDGCNTRNEIISISDDDSDGYASLDTDRNSCISGNSRAPITKKRKIRPVSTSEEEDDEEDEMLRLKVDQRAAIDKETISLELEHATTINVRIQEWLKEAEDIKAKTKNMRGSNKGRLRVLIQAIKRSANLLSTKASSTEDPLFWREKCAELQAENEDLKRKIEVLDTRIRVLEKANLNLSAYEKDDLIDDGMQVESDRIPPAFRPSLQGKRKLLDDIKSVNSVYSERNVSECGGAHSVVSQGVENSVNKYSGNANLEFAVIKALDGLNSGFTTMFQEMRGLFDRSFDALIKSRSSTQLQDDDVAGDN